MVDIESFRSYCLSKPGTSEGLPFGDTTLVFKVMGKMFSLCSVDNFDFINLKCNPERAVELRDQYPAIQPGYHMNKQHWNSVYVDGTLPDALIYELVDHSYDLVAASLTKQLKQELAALKG